MLVIAYLSHRSESVYLLLSFAIICLHISYAVPIALKLKRNEWGMLLLDAPWRLGSWSIPVDMPALAWLLTTAGLAAGFVNYWGAIAAACFLVLVSATEWRYRKCHFFRVQSRVKRSRNELYRKERKFPLN
jgi:hypothetical protein